MRTHFCAAGQIAAVVVLAAALSAAGCDIEQPPGEQATDESREPPLSFTIQIGDKAVLVKEAETAKLPGKYTDPTIKVTVDRYRVFPYGGISFQYPRHFAFEADLSPTARMWTLDGNDCVIMYHVYTVRVSPDDFVKNLAERYGRKNCEITESTLKLGKQTFDGMAVRAKVAGEVIIQKVYSLPHKGRGTRILLLQDSLDDHGQPSKEHRQVLSILKSSFKTKE